MSAQPWWRARAARIAFFAVAFVIVVVVASTWGEGEEATARSFLRHLFRALF
jgi:hypothetical protein